MIDIVAIIAFFGTSLSMLATFLMWNYARTTPGVTFRMKWISGIIVTSIWLVSGYHLFGLSIF